MDLPTVQFYGGIFLIEVSLLSDDFSLYQVYIKLTSIPMDKFLSIFLFIFIALMISSSYGFDFFFLESSPVFVSCLGFLS